MIFMESIYSWGGIAVPRMHTVLNCTEEKSVPSFNFRSHSRTSSCGTRYVATGKCPCSLKRSTAFLVCSRIVKIGCSSYVYQDTSKANYEEPLHQAVAKTVVPQIEPSNGQAIDGLSRPESTILPKEMTEIYAGRMSDVYRVSGGTTTRSEDVGAAFSVYERVADFKCSGFTDVLIGLTSHHLHHTPPIDHCQTVCAELPETTHPTASLIGVDVHSDAVVLSGTLNDSFADPDLEVTPLSAIAPHNVHGVANAYPWDTLLASENNSERIVGSETDGIETIKITKFLKGKSILVTGSTGFLAKVLVEKILRVQPDVGQLYLLIQPRSDTSIDSRLENQIINSDLFRELRSWHGDNYKDFMHRKLTAVSGNLALPGLGIDSTAMDAIASTIDVIVNSAATTTFDERYDVALNINTMGPKRILDFAKQCPNLKLLLQVSTAFVNGNRRGIIPEKPFCMGDNLAKELWSTIHSSGKFMSFPVESNTVRSKHFPRLDPDYEVRLAEETLYQAERAYTESGNSDSISPKDQMVELGLKRARMFGWQDTYVFTKAMGEMMIDAHRGEIPVAIVRPSVVESTFREPFCGWMEGVRMLDPIVLAYGKGTMEGFLVDPEAILDVVPADIVVNVILASMTKHAGCKQTVPSVYQVASSVINPLKMWAISQFSHNHFRGNPMVDKDGKEIQVEEMILYRREHEYLLHLWLKYKLPLLISKLPWLKKDKRLAKQCNILQKTFEHVSHLAKIYKPYLFYEGRFQASNTRALLQQISLEEQDTFGYDVSSVDWNLYLNDIHIPGLRQHVLKGRGTKSRSVHWKV